MELTVFGDHHLFVSIQDIAIDCVFCLFMFFVDQLKGHRENCEADDFTCRMQDFGRGRLRASSHEVMSAPIV